MSGMQASDLDLLLAPAALAELRRCARGAARAPAADACDRRQRLLAAQLTLRQRAAGKLPSWKDSDALYSARALEQCSGEGPARFKAGMMQGERLADLTLGLGVDSAWCAGGFAQSIGCEQDPVLARLADHDCRCHAAAVSVQQRDACAWLAEQRAGSWDWLLVDPDRRVAGKRVCDPGAGSPDLPACWPALRACARGVMAKLAPGCRLAAVPEALPGLSRLIVVSWRGECREVLAVVTPRPQPLQLEAVVVDASGRSLRAVAAGDPADPQRAATPGAVIGVPDPAIAKAGLQAQLAAQCGASLLDAPGRLLSAGAASEATGVRWYTVEAVVSAKAKAVRAELRRIGAERARVMSFAPRLSAPELQKRFGLREGGAVFVLVYRDARERLQAAITRQLVA